MLHLLTSMTSMIQTQFSKKPEMKTGIIISGLLLIAVFWFTRSIYFYYLDDFAKYNSSVISTIISLLLCLIFWISVIIYQKVKAKNNMLALVNEALPDINEISKSLNIGKIKLGLLLAMMAAGYFSYRKQNQKKDNK